MDTELFRKHLVRRLAQATRLPIAAIMLAAVAGCDDGTECFDWSEAQCPSRTEALRYIETDCGEYVQSVDSAALRDDEACCYQVTLREAEDACCSAFEQCVVEGRPLRLDGEPLVARAARRAGWIEDRLLPRVDDLSDAEREALAAWWTRAALDEHASIASFSRFALELMGLGAPSALVAAAHQAALDEVHHAAASFALASAYVGEPVGPSALDLPAALPLERDLSAFAVATAVDACVNETLAVLVASEACAQASDPAVAQLLADIVREEAEHAELAWSTLRWAIDIGGPAVRLTVAYALRDYDPLSMDRAVDRPVPAHGLLDASARSAALSRGWERVVAPCLDALLRSPQIELAAPPMRASLGVAS